MQVVGSNISKDVQEFQFKLHRQIQIFDPLDLPPSKLNLIAVASRYGILFVGAPNNTLHILQINDIIQGTGKKCVRRIIHLPSNAIHLSINCDNELLSIALIKNNSLVVLVYNTISFIENEPIINKEIRLPTSQNATLCSLEWNPCQADSLAVCTSDGSLSIFQCKPNSIDLQTKNTNARCLSWSPKGKQLVTGNSDGTLSQYKPDLTPVKSIPSPNIYENTTPEVLTIQWLSTYQFCVVYKDPSAENQPCITIVNTPKTGNFNCINYEDICYSMDGGRDINFYLIFVSSWGIILSSSANSMEIGVLGTSDQLNWQQWIQSDDSRAELPLTEKKEENYPVGICFDTANTIQLPWGENAVLPYMPMVHVLSHTGMLVTYFTINLIEKLQSLCRSPETLFIPSNFLTEEFHIASQQLESIHPSAFIPLSSSDVSFAISQNTVTSTPTIPKSNKNILKNDIFKLENKLSSAISNTEIIEPQKNEDKTKINNNISNLLPTNLNSQFINTMTGNIALIKNSNGNLKYSTELSNQSIEKQISNDKLNNISKNNVKTNDSDHVKNEIIKTVLNNEVNNFQKEIQELLERCKKIDTEIGTNEEMEEIATTLNECNKNPLKHIWSDQEIEMKMTILKHNLINTCAFLAEAKVQPVLSEFEQLTQLDPVSAEKMSSIKSSVYYIESQLEQINRALDEHWELFQNTCKKKAAALVGLNDNDDMKMPTLDKIYKPLLKQADILAKQQLIVLGLDRALSSLGILNKVNSLKNTQTSKEIFGESLQISGLTKDLLNMNVQSNKLKINDVNLEMKIKNKNNTLRKMLEKYNTVKIKPSKVEAPLLESYLNYILPEDAIAGLELSNSKTITVQENEIESGNNYTETLYIIEDKPPLNISNNAVLNINIKQEEKPKPVSEIITISNSEKTFKQPTSIISSNNENKQYNNIIDSFAPPQNVSTVPQNIVLKNSLQSTSFSAISQTLNTCVNSKLPSNTSASIISTQGMNFPLKNSIISTKSDNILSTTTQNNVNKVQTTTTTATISTPILSVAENHTSIFPKEQINNLNSIPKSTTQTDVTNLDTNKFVFSFKSPVSENNTVNSINMSSKTIQFSASTSLNILKDTTISTLISDKDNNDVENINKSKLTITPITIVSTSETVQNPSLTQVTSVPSTSVEDVSVKNTDISSTIRVLLSQASVSTSDSLTISQSDTEVINQTAQPDNVEIQANSIEKDIKSDEIIQSDTISADAQSKSETNNSVKTTEQNVFGFGNFSSLFGSSTTATTSTTDPLFENTQSPNLQFDNITTTSASTFNVTTTASSIFSQIPPVNTCASTLFGAANASIVTSVSNIFGNTSISDNNSSIFKPSTTTAGSIFGGSSTFNNQTFGKSGSSIFGNTESNTFGNQQAAPIFGTSSTFGAFENKPQSSNIFGQTSQSNIFGSPSNTQNDIFGGKSTFGSPTTSSITPQSSIFGSPVTTAPPVFGGSPTFGSKPVFGQAASSPSGSFGLFSGGEQSSTAQTGFGSPSTFGKPSGIFGGSSEFGGSPTFGSAPTFGGSPTFGSNANTFGSSMNMQPAFGSQQSATFESLASQNSLSFGNLAQQSQSQPPAPTIFQSSPSFSNWR